MSTSPFANDAQSRGIIFCFLFWEGPAPGPYQEEHLTVNVLAMRSVSLSHDVFSPEVIRDVRPRTPEQNYIIIYINLMSKRGRLQLPVRVKGGSMCTLFVIFYKTCLSSFSLLSWTNCISLDLLFDGTNYSLAFISPLAFIRR